MKRNTYKYEEYHKIENDILYKKCCVCGKWLPCNTEYFYTNKCNKSDGLYPMCKECNKESTHKYIKDHPEWNRERSKTIYAEDRFNQRERVRKAGRAYRHSELYKKWCEENKDRLKQYRDNKEAHDITEEEWIKCKEYFGYKCAYCGLPIQDHFVEYGGEMKLFDFSKEHVIHNGSNYIENCVPACKQCNSSKKTFEFVSWYKKQDFYTDERYDRILKWMTEESFK